MSETGEVLDAISRATREGRKMALATIVGVTGSTYRRPGARLLVSETGEMTGNLSGGCLEGEVVQVAKSVMAEERPRLVSYDLTADDEVVWGWGLGCNGAIDVFVEPAAKAAETAEVLRRALEEERPIASVTVLESPAPDIAPGSRMLIHPDGSTEGTLGPPGLDETAAAAGRAALGAGITETRDLDSDAARTRVFVEVMRPSLRLLVCGAGHDAIPVVRVAAGLGWRPVVVDDREALLARERFPEASAFVRTEPKDAAQTAGIDEHTCAVVMSHNYLRDRDYLRSFLGSGLSYLGMLGPKARVQRLLGDLRAEGVEIGPADLAVVHGPAGLDVGAEGPDEIALAIVTEILALTRSKSAGFLRDRSGPIHERDARAVPQPG